MSLFTTVKFCNLPLGSDLHNRYKDGDFIDCYVTSAEIGARPAAEIITNFPKWARGLLKVRSAVVSPFGLSTEGPDAADKLGLFPVESETEQELIAGFNDKHLDFRVSVISEEGQVFLATWVRTNNFWGKVYLLTILPFHVLVARDALRRVSALA